MKVNVQVDCTPEEARAFMGLPDVRPLQEAMMGEISERMRSAMHSMDPEQLFKTWFGTAAPGLEQWQKFWSQFAAGAGTTKT
jgi:Family of unknown function (DUF6489)